MALIPVTLALGIGANTAIFSVVNGVLMKPLPFRDSDRLIGLWHSAPGIGFPTLEQGSATYFLYRDSGTAFEDIGLWDNTAVSVTGIGEPERVQALRLTDGTLGLLRVEPLLGRRFTRDDDTHPAPAPSC